MSAASPPACGSEHCITCGDDAIEMRVVRLDEARGLALCLDAAGAPATVEITLVDGVASGARLLVHAGTAIACIDSRGGGGE